MPPVVGKKNHSKLKGKWSYVQQQKREEEEEGEEGKKNEKMSIIKTIKIHKYCWKNEF